MGKTPENPSNTSDDQELFGDGGPEKPVGFHDKPMGIYQRLPHRSDTGGVSPMVLEGREKFMKERMRGMTPEQRAYRKQWLQDQILTDREPVEVPQIYYELNNVFKRTINYPFNKLERYILRKTNWVKIFVIYCSFHLVIINQYFCLFQTTETAFMWKNAAKFGLVFIGLAYYGVFVALYYNNVSTRSKKKVL